MVIELIEDALNGRTVRFRSSAGVGAGRWRGPSVAANTTVDVEFEFRSNLRWMDDVRPADNDQQTGFDSMGHAILYIERQQDDGVLAARLGSSLVLLSTKGELPPVAGKLVSLRATSLELYPTGI